MPRNNDGNDDNYDDDDGNDDNYDDDDGNDDNYDDDDGDDDNYDDDDGDDDRGNEMLFCFCLSEVSQHWHCILSLFVR